MEYASAGTLKSLIKQCGDKGLPEKTVRCYTRMILKGLDHMHTRGYIYWDLKPNNILAFRSDDDQDGCYSLKLADIGWPRSRERRYREEIFRADFEGL